MMICIARCVRCEQATPLLRATRHPTCVLCAYRSDIKYRERPLPCVSLMLALLRARLLKLLLLFQGAAAVAALSRLKARQRP